jgi:hypothetical protein
MLSIFLEAAEFRHWKSGMEEKFLGIYNFVAVPKTRCSGERAGRPRAQGCCAGGSIYNLVRVFD